jgi:hypothetical protein
VRIQFAESSRPAPTGQTGELEEGLRLFLLQELIQSLEAEVTREKQDDLIILELRWNQANLRRHLPL